MQGHEANVGAFETADDADEVFDDVGVRTRRIRTDFEAALREPRVTTLVDDGRQELGDGSTPLAGDGFLGDPSSVNAAALSR